MNKNWTFIKQLRICLTQFVVSDIGYCYHETNNLNTDRVFNKLYNSQEEETVEQPIQEDIAVDSPEVETLVETMDRLDSSDSFEDSNDS